jgi:hypothetical protein
MERGNVFALAASLAFVAACGSSSSAPASGPGGPPAIAFGTRGPWPVENAIYGSDAGIRESPVVGVTTDEAQNRWVATRDALYLLRPGEKKFRRYAEADGLHLHGNVVRYCDDHPLVDGDHCGGEISTGSGLAITRIVGGAPGEVFVGYLGVDTFSGSCPPKDPTRPWSEGDYCDPNRHSGKLDRVRVRTDGTLAVDRFDIVANRQGGEFWHDRSVESLAYDHFGHPHTLYAGMTHGMTILFPDRYRMPRRDEWFDLAYVEWMGNHLHARVCDGIPCPPNGEAQRAGDWWGAAVDAKGDLWHAGRWTAGLITWEPNPVDWFERGGRAFAQAFGDPYPQPPNSEGFTNEPVFKVAREGDSVWLTGVAVCPDGRVWFSSSGPQSGTTDTVAVWKGSSFETFPASRFGLAERGLRDVECLPDGRVVLASFGSGVVLYDPRAGTSKPVPGLPSGGILDVEVDRMIDPPSLHVATDAGAAVLRLLP